MREITRKGRKYTLTKTDGQHYKRKLTADQVREIRFGGETLQALADRYGVSPNVIWLCSSGKTYKDQPMNPAQPNGRQPRKFTEADIRAIRSRYEAGELATHIANSLGAARASIYSIVNRTAYKWVK